MTDGKFKINILTTDGPQYLYLIHKLENAFTVNLVIVEPGKCQRKKLIRKRKVIRYVYNRYHAVIRRVLGHSKHRKKYFKFSDIIHSDIVCVEDINSNFVIEILNQNSSNLCVVMGTSILSKKVIEACKVNIINIHGGYLPYYRGNNCIFFAYLNNDFEKIANTIHYINEGIDTGDIIEIVTPYIDSTDNPETLYCKAKKKAIDRLIDILHDYIQLNCTQRIPQDLSLGKQYKTEDRKVSTDILYLYKKITGRFKYK